MNNNGFSLLELMIAVAIVGILASLAVPAYQNYTIRAKVSEALQLGMAAKFSVSEYYVSNGRIPADLEAAGIDETQTRYVSDIDYTKSEDEEVGQITLTMSDNLGADANNKKLVLEASVDGQLLKWECRAAETDGLSAEHLPASCR